VPLPLHVEGMRSIGRLGSGGQPFLRSKTPRVAIRPRSRNIRPWLGNSEMRIPTQVQVRSASHRSPRIAVGAAGPSSERYGVAIVRTVWRPPALRIVPL
jgi:hypothetical protein